MIDLVFVFFAFFSAKISISGMPGDTIEINYNVDDIAKQKSFIYNDEQTFDFSDFQDSSRGEIHKRDPIIEIPQEAKGISIKYRKNYIDSIVVGEVIGCIRVSNDGGMIKLEPYNQSNNSGPKEQIQRKIVGLKKNWIKKDPDKFVFLRNDSIEIKIRKAQVDTRSYFMEEYLRSINEHEIPQSSPLFGFSQKPFNVRIIERFIASVLEAGECDIVKHNSNSNARYSRVMIEQFLFDCGGLCGWKGRRFYIGDILLLEVIDEMY